MNFRNSFPFFKSKINRNITYFDSASTTQKLDVFLEKLNYYYTEKYSNVHRSFCSLSSEVTESFEKEREKIAQILNVKSNEICFVPSATYGLNLLASSLKKTKVLTSTLEHNSNLLPWFNNNHVLEIIPSNKGRFNYSNINLLSKKSNLVSLTHASNVTGEILDLNKLDFIDETPLILDSSQYCSHEIPDLSDVSASVFSMHKIFGGNGLGILYVREDFQKNLSPKITGGGTVSSLKLTKSLKPDFLEFPRGFEAGTQNIPVILSSSCCLEFLNKNKIEITKTNNTLKKLFLNKLKDFPSVQVFSVESGLPIISFQVKGIHAHDLSFLMGQQGFCFRAGNHCAQLLSQELNTASLNRISLHCYNTSKEIDKFFQEFDKVLLKLSV